MNRLKLSFATIAALLLSTAAAADVNLASVEVNTASNVTTLTVHTTGAFTHKEFLPTASLIFLDLTGVSASRFTSELHPVHAPGVLSYRVSGYKDAKGTEITRLEVAVAANTSAAFREMPNGLALKIEPKAAPAAAATPAAAPAATSAAVPANAPVASLPQTDNRAAAGNAVVIQNVGVSHTPDGIQVEIDASAPLQQKALHLTNPERLVIDLPNSVPSAQRTIPVNAPEARDVRVAQFTSTPPVTRVVVDLAAGTQYSVSSKDNRVLVNLHTGTSTSASSAKQPAPAGNTPAGTKTASTGASPTSKTATQPTAGATPASPKQAAAVASTAPKATAPVLKQAAFKSNAKAASKQPAPSQPAAAKKASDNTSAKSDAAQAAANNAPHTDAAPAADSTIAQNSAAQDFVVANVQPKTDVQPTTESDPAPTTAAPAPKEQPAPESKPVRENATPAMAAANLAREQQQTMQTPRSAPRPKYTGAPYSFNLKDADLKDFFRAIAEITGLNIVLDPNVKGTLTLDLHDVPWDQALDIVLENNSLDKQLDGNVLRIATIDTMRKEAEGQLAKEQAQALAVGITTYTHYLSYAHSKDVIQTLKKFLSQRGDISADERTNAVIVRDIPSTIPEIQRLLIQLDRKTQQVEIEARVIAATRNFAREIGTQLAVAFGGSVNGSAVTGNGAPAAGQSPIAQGYNFPPPYATNPGVPLPQPNQPPQTTFATIPLFSNLGVTAPTSGYGIGFLTGNFRLDTLLTMAESRGLLKVLSRPSITTQNNVKALIKQGLRVPVVTQAQLGGPPTVTYVDAMLKLTVTPQITAEGTVFLDIDVENTTADFSREVQGNPTLVTQGEQTQVLVSNGGTVQIGGVMLTNNTVNTFQVPLLGDIPILGNAFKHRQVSTSTQELIFFITPKIIES